MLYYHINSATVGTFPKTYRPQQSIQKKKNSIYHNIGGLFNMETYGIDEEQILKASKIKTITFSLYDFGLMFRSSFSCKQI